MGPDDRACDHGSPCVLKIETYQSLSDLKDHFGPRKFGVICQKLLALALRQCGYEHVVEREVQGVDIDARKIGVVQYAIEVKTTQDAHVVLGIKDFDALDSRVVDGYPPVIAVLRFSALGDWVAVHAETLLPGRHLVAGLTPHRISTLEAEVNTSFDAVVQELTPQVLEDGIRVLDALLRPPTAKRSGVTAQK
jgi:hypothetical protein